MVTRQDLHQLEEIYGHAVTKSLSNLTGTKVLFRNVDTEVATRVAKYLGEQEKQEASESISFGAHQMRDGVNLSNQKQTRPVVTPSQIMMLKDLEAFLKLPGNFPVTKLSFPYLNLNYIAPIFIEKPIKTRPLATLNLDIDAVCKPESESIEIDPLLTTSEQEYADKQAEML